jgi:hypothetical protein
MSLSVLMDTLGVKLMAKTRFLWPIQRFVALPTSLGLVKLLCCAGLINDRVLLSALRKCHWLKSFQESITVLKMSCSTSAV